MEQDPLDQPSPYEPSSVSSCRREDNPVVYLDLAAGDGAAAEPLGRLLIELRRDVCPVASENFLVLVQGKLGNVDGVPFMYKGTRLHRIVRDILLQGGDLKDSQGECSHSIYNRGGVFRDENFILRHVGAGVLSCLNRGPDSNGSLFQIALAAVPMLDERHVVFGCVVDEASLRTLTRVNRLGSSSGEPTATIRIAECGVAFPLSD